MIYYANMCYKEPLLHLTFSVEVNKLFFHINLDTVCMNMYILLVLNYF